MKERKVISQLCWLASLGGSRSIWHAIGGGVAGGFAVAGVILAGVIAAGLIWPHQRPVSVDEDQQRQELLGRLAADMRQVTHTGRPH